MLLNSSHTLLLNISYSHPNPHTHEAQIRKGKGHISYGEIVAFFFFLLDWQIGDCFPKINFSPVKSNLVHLVDAPASAEQNVAEENHTLEIARVTLKFWMGPLISMGPSVLYQFQYIFLAPSYMAISYFCPQTFSTFCPILRPNCWMNLFPISLRKSSTTSHQQG